MNATVLVDHEPVADGGYLVHALFRMESTMLSLVLYRSGSLHAGKLEAARAATAMLLRRLHNSETVSVVA